MKYSVFTDFFLKQTNKPIEDSSNICCLMQNTNLFTARRRSEYYIKVNVRMGKKRLPVSNDFLFIFCDIIEVIHWQFGKAKLCVLLQPNCLP